MLVRIASLRTINSTVMPEHDNDNDRDRDMGIESSGGVGELNGVPRQGILASLPEREGDGAEMEMVSRAAGVGDSAPSQAMPRPMPRPRKAPRAARKAASGRNLLSVQLEQRRRLAARRIRAASARQLPLGGDKPGNKGTGAAGGSSPGGRAEGAMVATTGAAKSLSMSSSPPLDSSAISRLQLKSVPEHTADTVLADGLEDDMAVLGRYVLLESFESEEQLQQRCVIHPSGWFRRYWALVMLLLIFVTAVQVPLVIGFSIGSGTGITAFEAVVDVLFALDLLLSFRTAFFSEEHDAVVAVPWMIGNRYMQTDFIIDVISTVPIDQIVDASIGGGSEYRSLRLLRSVRLIRLLRLLKLFRFFRLRRISDNLTCDISLPPAVLRISVLLF